MSRAAECERSSEELRRELDRLEEATEALQPLRRRMRAKKRDLGMYVEDSGSHEAITVPNGTIVVSDPFPSPTDIARPPRPSR